MPSVTAMGTSHTQWCDQDTGEQTSATVEASRTDHRRESTRTIAQTTRPRASRTRMSQTRESADSPGSASRARNPRSDWLEEYDSPPMRPVSRRVSSQYVREFSQCTAAAARVKPTPARNVTAAFRHSRRTRNTRMNTAGVSLMAAASPMSTPRGSQGRRVRVSTSTSVMSRMLICPKPMVSRTGSATSAKGRIQVATMRWSASRGAAWRRTMTRHHHSRSTDARVQATRATAYGTNASGMKSIAASGG